VDGFIAGSAGTSVSGIGGAILSLGGFATPTSKNESAGPTTGSNGTVIFTGKARGVRGDLYVCVEMGVVLWVGILGILML
jgi:hypothetical protein